MEIRDIVDTYGAVLGPKWAALTNGPWAALEKWLVSKL